MLDREDVERIIDNVLRDLTISMTTDHVTDPNDRCITLRFHGREIDRVYFNVEQVDTNKH